ncbi:MAG: T3SS (YopN, CesT) and YbjN peptide-binding chaperone 1 [Phocaeicola sp.]
MKEKILSYLLDEGYRPAIDEDGDVAFKVEGVSMYFSLSEDDPGFVRLILPNFWRVDDLQEYERSLRVANKLNSTYKAGKIFIHNNYLISTVELFVYSTDKIEEILVRIISILRRMTYEFAELMQRENS